jgi:hypothetical protein
MRSDEPMTSSETSLPSVLERSRTSRGYLEHDASRGSSRISMMLFCRSSERA